MKKFTGIIAATAAYVPMIAFAQNTGYITTLLGDLRTILSAIIPLMIGIAFIVFFWELIVFIKAKKDGKTDEVKSAKMGLVWAIVALFIMFSFMGIIRILQGVTGTGGNNQIDQDDIPVFTF